MVTGVYEEVPIEAPPEVVVAALRDVLRERGITEYAVVDHGHDMAAAGQAAYPAWTLIFGNPAAARLLTHDLAAAGLAEATRERVESPEDLPAFSSPR
jgi:uncharacterized protein (DUF302 family)